MNLNLRSVNVLICEFFGFRRVVFDVSVLQQCGAVSLDSWFLTFLDTYIVSKCQQPFAHWHTLASQKNKDLCFVCVESELLPLFRPLVCWSGGTGFVDPTWEAESEDSLWTALPVAVRSVHCHGTSQVKSCSCYKTRELLRKGKLYPCARQCLGLAGFWMLVIFWCSVKNTVFEQVALFRSSG